MKVFIRCSGLTKKAIKGPLCFGFSKRGSSSGNYQSWSVEFG